MTPRSATSLDLVDHVAHTENVPGVPFGRLITVKKKENKDGKKRSIIGSEQSYLGTCATARVGGTWHKSSSSGSRSASPTMRRMARFAGTGFQLARSDFAPLQSLMYRQARGGKGR
jgi:hypothetical protein